MRSISQRLLGLQRRWGTSLLVLLAAAWVIAALVAASAHGAARRQRFDAAGRTAPTAPARAPSAR